MNNVTFLKKLIQALVSAGAYNANDQAPPACIIWTDQDGQWQGLISLLKEHLPIFQLGQYEPEFRSGPAYWLRCVIAGVLPEVYSPEEGTPILYFPGISRQELRAVDDCPKALQPLAELQYRGVFWSQRNGKDWTISAFLQSHDGGLGIQVSSDQATRDALQRALSKLADRSISELSENAPLKAAYFDNLLNPDERRNLLQWMNDPIAFRKTLSDQEWQAFCSISQQKYKFHPEKDGPLNAALLLGERENNWIEVWARYKEIPSSYPNIPLLLRQVRPAQFNLFDKSEAWPQDNEAAEEELRDGLMSLSELNVEAARNKVLDLEKIHASRRGWVWSKLGKSPLANLIGYLSFLVRLTTRIIVNGNTVIELANSYQEEGYKIDFTTLLMLEIVQKDGSSQDVEAARVAIHSVYKPWLEGTAQAFQQAVRRSGYVASAISKPQSGTCILFIDAFRMDLGYQLAEFIKDECVTVIAPHLAALPPVTSTSKPALSPTKEKIDGKSSHDLKPTISGKTASLTAESFRKLLGEDGFQILGQNELGKPDGIGWTEIGQIDTYGHQHGIRLALHIPDEMTLIRKRIIELLNHGWKRVVVVTDHGWLLLPGGLPKAHLPEHLTETRKGRCARLKEGSVFDHQTLPWYWDSNATIAFAPGISCYEAGKEYEHGGLSIQECVTPIITIELKDAEENITFSEVKWKGLRCVIEIEGSHAELKADLRLRPNDPDTSIAISPKAVSDDVVSIVVEDEDYTGKNVFIIILNSDGKIVAQKTTVVGG
jgi:hypothetical protein